MGREQTSVWREGAPDVVFFLFLRHTRHTTLWRRVPPPHTSRLFPPPRVAHTPCRAPATRWLCVCEHATSVHQHRTMSSLVPAATGRAAPRRVRSEGGGRACRARELVELVPWRAPGAQCGSGGGWREGGGEERCFFCGERRAGEPRRAGCSRRLPRPPTANQRAGCAAMLANTGLRCSRCASPSTPTARLGVCRVRRRRPPALQVLRARLQDGAPPDAHDFGE